MIYKGTLIMVSGFYVQIDGISWYKNLDKFNEFHNNVKKNFPEDSNIYKYAKNDAVVWDNLSLIVSCDCKGNPHSIRTENIDKVPGFDTGVSFWKEHLLKKDIKLINYICEKAVKQVKFNIENCKVIIG